MSPLFDATERAIVEAAAIVKFIVFKQEIQRSLLFPFLLNFSDNIGQAGMKKNCLKAVFYSTEAAFFATGATNFAPSDSLMIRDNLPDWSTLPKKDELEP